MHLDLKRSLCGAVYSEGGGHSLGAHSMLRKGLGTVLHLGVVGSKTMSSRRYTALAICFLQQICNETCCNGNFIGILGDYLWVAP